MSNYKYKNPLDDGYKQFKLTKKQHNKLFKYRQIKWCDRYEYYYNEQEIIMHRYVNLMAIIIETLLFPIYVLLHGFVNIKELNKEYKEIFNQKKYGAFVGDSISRESDTYQKVIDVINKTK